MVKKIIKNSYNPIYILDSYLKRIGSETIKNKQNCLKLHQLLQNHLRVFPKFKILGMFIFNQRVISVIIEYHLSESSAHSKC